MRKVHKTDKYKAAEARGEGDRHFAEQFVRRRFPEFYHSYRTINQATEDARKIICNAEEKSTKEFVEVAQQLTTIQKNGEEICRVAVAVDHLMQAHVEKRKANQYVTDNDVRQARTALHAFRERLVKLRETRDEHFLALARRSSKVIELINKYREDIPNLLDFLRLRSILSFETRHITIVQHQRNLLMFDGMNVKWTEKLLFLETMPECAKLSATDLVAARRLVEEPQFLEKLIAGEAAVENVLKEMRAVEAELRERRESQSAKVIRENNEFREYIESIIKEVPWELMKEEKEMCETLNSFDMDFFKPNLTQLNEEINKKLSLVLTDISGIDDKIKEKLLDGLKKINSDFYSKVLKILVEKYHSFDGLMYCFDAVRLLCKMRLQETSRLLVEHEYIAYMKNEREVAKNLLMEMIRDNQILINILSRMLEKVCVDYEEKVEREMDEFKKSSESMRLVSLKTEDRAACEKLLNDWDNRNRGFSEPKLLFLFEQRRLLKRFKMMSKESPQHTCEKIEQDITFQMPDDSAFKFSTLTEVAYEVFRNDDSLLPILKDLFIGQGISLGELDLIVTQLGGTVSTTGDQHYIYKLPNIWEKPTDRTLTIGVSHRSGHTTLKIQNLDVLGSIKREFREAGLDPVYLSRVILKSHVTPSIS